MKSKDRILSVFYSLGKFDCVYLLATSIVFIIGGYGIVSIFLLFQGLIQPSIPNYILAILYMFFSLTTLLIKKYKIDFDKIDSSEYHEIEDYDDHLIFYTIEMKNQRAFDFHEKDPDEMFYTKEQVLSQLESILPDNKMYRAVEIHEKEFNEKVEYKELDVEKILEGTD